VSQDPNLVKIYFLDPDQIWIWNLTYSFESKNNFINPVVANSNYAEKMRAIKDQLLCLRQLKLNPATKIEFCHQNSTVATQCPITPTDFHRLPQWAPILTIRTHMLDG
jgi:hypothetical protein